MALYSVEYIKLPISKMNFAPKMFSLLLKIVPIYLNVSSLNQLFLVQARQRNTLGQLFVKIVSVGKSMKVY